MTAPTFSFTKRKDETTGVEYARMDYLSNSDWHELDPDTGLPKVPAGHEWVIEQRKYGGDKYYMVLRKTVVVPRWWGGEATETEDVRYSVFPASMELFTDDLVLSEALYVLRCVAQDAKQLSAKEHNNKYLGSYPPKKLG